MTAHAELIGWAAGALGEDKLVTAVVAETPYSTVIRVDVGQASYYLKQTPPDLFIETEIIKTCRDFCGVTAIPKLVASNPRLNCFLMTSCGDTSLRRLCGGNTERTDVKPDIDLTVRALTLYRDLQQKTVPHVDRFVEIGVPDWRLDKLPALYQQLASDIILLQSYGLDALQIAGLQALVPDIASKCRDLAAFGINPCLNHSDLHDDNMMLETATHTISIIDLGETTIDHPFLSLSVCLGWFERGYKIDKTSQLYRQLFAACFDDWPVENDSMAGAISLAEDLSFLYWVLSKQRLVIAAGRQIMNGIDDQMDSRIKNVLLIFLARMTDQDPAIYNTETLNVF